MILHIPHSSTRVDQLVEMDREEENLALLTDILTERLFSYPCERVIFPFSRFVCDVERFRDGDPMEKYGMGMIYTRDVFGSPIRRNISDSDVLRMYEKHHAWLTSAVTTQLQKQEVVVIVDCHSFKVAPDIPVLPDHGPDICIGTDSFHTPVALIRLVAGYFSSCGINVAENTPYSGTIVPLKYLHREKRVLSIMLEINKRIYLDDFTERCAVIRKALDLIAQYEQRPTRNS